MSATVAPPKRESTMLDIMIKDMEICYEYAHDVEKENCSAFPIHFISQNMITLLRITIEEF